MRDDVSCRTGFVLSQSHAAECQRRWTRALQGRVTTAALSYDPRALPVDVGGRVWRLRGYHRSATTGAPAAWFMTAGGFVSIAQLALSICSKVGSPTLHATPESRRKHRSARQSKLTNRDGLAHVGFAPRHPSWSFPRRGGYSCYALTKCVFRLRKRAHA